MEQIEQAIATKKITNKYTFTAKDYHSATIDYLRHFEGFFFWAKDFAKTRKVKHSKTGFLHFTGGNDSKFSSGQKKKYISDILLAVST